MQFSFHDRGSVIVNDAACTGCGLCVKNCPDEVLSLENGKARAETGFSSGALPADNARRFARRKRSPSKDAA